jgi:hypothetical protein
MSKDFIAALSPRGEWYGSVAPRSWIFRGHANDWFRLVPAALRNGSKELSELVLCPIANNKNQQWAENRALADFLHVSDSIGLNIPEDTQKLRRSLEIEASPADVWPPDEILSLMALAQHHGVPTRLLDWSRHPLKAALFAASSAVATENKSECLSVWALSIEKLEMLRGEPKPFIVITAPSATNSNLRAQEGIFTLAKKIKADSSPIDRRPFDQILQETFEKYKLKAPGPWFHRVTLPQSEAEQLCFDLALDGINHATLFPDFYGVVKAMKDTARWYGAKDGPGKKRSQQYLESFSISYETTINLNPP